MSKEQAPGIAAALAFGNEKYVKELRTSGGLGYATQRALATTFSDASREPRERHNARSVDHYKGNYDYVVSRLGDINRKLATKWQMPLDTQFIKPAVVPKGALQVTLDCSGLRHAKIPANNARAPGKNLETGLDLADYLVHTNQVKLAPGDAFYFDKEDMMERLTLAHSREKIIEGMDRIEQGLLALEPPHKALTRATGRRAKPVGLGATA